MSRLMCACGALMRPLGFARASYSSVASGSGSPFPRIPAPRGPYVDAASLLRSTKRTEGLAEQFDSWEALFGTPPAKLKESTSSLSVRERRYLLWFLEKFRQGGDPKEYAVKLKPKKKVRGWGPKIQNGKRVR